jgi:hypothetical protein
MRLLQKFYGDYRCDKLTVNIYLVNFDTLSNLQQTNSNSRYLIVNATSYVINSYYY